jgi:hypothetical protein
MMKIYPNAITTYRTAQKEFYQINLLSFKVRDRASGNPQWFHFSNRDENETIQVRDQSTGALEFRDYVGGGSVVGMDALIRSEGTSVRNFSLTLSGASEEVLDMIQGYDCREAVFEWHIGEGEEGTGLMVDTPVCEFEGFVDAIEHEDAAIDFEASTPAASGFAVSITSHVSTLQRANPDMRSHEVGQERSGDDIFLHSDAANHWDVMWGKRGHRHKDNDGGDGRDRPTEPGDPWGHR